MTVDSEEHHKQDGKQQEKPPQGVHALEGKLDEIGVFVQKMVGKNEERSYEGCIENSRQRPPEEALVHQCAHQQIPLAVDENHQVE